MRRFVVVVLVSLALPAVVAAPAGADVHPVADLEADCNDDGRVHITGNELYTGGGTAVLDRQCVVTMAPDTLLWLDDVSIVSGHVFSVLNTEARSKIFLTRARIDTKDNLQLTAGCCSGDDVPEDHGVVYVNQSVLSGRSIEIGASGYSTGGYTLIQFSQLTATGDAPFPPRLLVRTGRLATLVAGANTFTSTNGVSVESSGGSSAVLALYNTFAPGVGTSRVTAGPGGSCWSFANTPPVPCS
jgi:hypothetical protein